VKRAAGLVYLRLDQNHNDGERAFEVDNNSNGTALVTAIHNRLVPTDGAASSVVRRYQPGSVVMAASLHLQPNALLETGPDAQNLKSPQCSSI
jgi:hypothetical protein